MSFFYFVFAMNVKNEVRTLSEREFMMIHAHFFLKSPEIGVNRHIDVASD